MSETKTIEFQPIEEYEHYLLFGNYIYGINRDTELTSWKNQKVSFPVEINGETTFIKPKEFFVSSGTVYFSAMVENNEYCLKQKDGVITNISELPPEPENKRIEFSGVVGDFEVEYKDKPYETYKHVKNEKGHFLNHQSSDFAFPVGDKALLYVRDNMTLYVIYTMPNGRPAKNSLMTIQSENIVIW